MSLPEIKITKYDHGSNTGPQRTVGSAKKLAVATPDAPYGFVARGLLIGVAGNVNIVFADNTSAVLPLQAGFNPIEHVQINSASTTATGLYWYD